MHIINTYAPHMGYGRDERDGYWKLIKEIMTTTPQNDIIIWTTDNNGQIARRNTNSRNEYQTQNEAHIGRWHYATESEKGNGGKLEKIMGKFHLTATNTIYTPKNNDKQKLVTWTSGDGKIKKQLDYILVNKETRNWVNNSRAQGTANPNSENQHKIICMEMRVKFKK